MEGRRKANGFEKGFKNRPFAILRFIFPLLLFSYGCSAIPPHTSIEHINKSGDFLYLSTSNGVVLRFDPARKMFVDRLEVPDLSEPIITNVLNDNGDILIFAKDRSFFNPSIVYKAEKGGERLERVAEISPEYKVVGTDDESFYFKNEEQFTRSRFDGDSERLKAIRYDKQFGKQSSDHFDAATELSVMSIWEDEQFYWFACIKTDPLSKGKDAGTLVLVSKSKNGGEISRFDSESSLKWRNISITGDENSILFFDSSSSFGFLISEFSKKEKSFKLTRKIYADRLFDDLTFAVGPELSESGPIWAFERGRFAFEKRPEAEPGSLYRFDKADLKLTEVLASGEFDYKTLRGGPYNAFFPDKDYIYFGVVGRRELSPSGCCIPYLFRVSRQDGSYEMFAVEGTTGEAIDTLYNYLRFWLIKPFFRG